LGSYQQQRKYKEKNMPANLILATSVNFSSTSLNGAINDSVDTFTLNSTTGLNTSGGAVINRQNANAENTPDAREVITWTGVSGSDLTGVTRGADGSTARSHTDGSLFEPILTVGMWNDQRTAILNVLTTAGALDTTKVVDLTTAQTLTNKTLTSPTITTPKITQRVVTTTDDATAAINCDTTDQYELSAVANATEFTVTGTPTDGQKLIIRFKDAGVAKALTFTGFTALGVTIPTTTIAGKWGYVGAIYNLGATTWHVVATVTEV